jgi:hypothetical protein
MMATLLNLKCQHDNNKKLQHSKHQVLHSFYMLLNQLRLYDVHVLSRASP